MRAALCNTEELHVVGNFAYNGYWDLIEDENYSDKRKQFFIKTKTEELHGGENPCLRIKERHAPSGNETLCRDGKGAAVNVTQRRSVVRSRGTGL